MKSAAQRKVDARARKYYGEDGCPECGDAIGFAVRLTHGVAHWRACETHKVRWFCHSSEMLPNGYPKGYVDELKCARNEKKYRYYTDVQPLGPSRSVLRRWAAPGWLDEEEMEDATFRTALRRQ